MTSCRSEHRECPSQLSHRPSYEYEAKTPRHVQLYGMERDLKITDAQYLLALTVFYFTYVSRTLFLLTSLNAMRRYSLLEVPSNMFIKRMSPTLWLGIIMVCWGICMVCTLSTLPL